MRESSPIERMAAYFSSVTSDDIPQDVLETAKLKLLDSLAVAYAGRSYEPNAVALKYGKALGSGKATLIIGEQPSRPSDAAFINAVAIHALLFDDVDLESGHPACTVIPAALALGEASHASGEDLLLALVCGYEAMWRIGGCGALLLAATRRGFRGNTILGAFGSAAASAKVLRFSEGETARALGTTASLAAGLLEPLNVGSMERSFQQANNARQGVTAAMVAKEGLEACLTVLDGKTGFYAAFGGLEGFPEEALESLGTTFRMGAAFSKPYPSAGSNTVGIAVAELARARLQVDPRVITAVDVRVLPRFTGIPGYPSIAFAGPFSTIEQALVSFPFQISCMLLYGRVDLETMSAHLGDSDLEKLAQSVSLIGTEVKRPLDCSVEVTDVHGNKWTADSDEIDWTRFYHDRREAKAKFMSFACEAMTETRAADIAEAILNVEAFGDVAEVGFLLRDEATKESSLGRYP